MTSPISHVLEAEPSREGDEIIIHIKLHAGVQFCFVLSPKQSKPLAEKLALLVASKNLSQ